MSGTLGLTLVDGNSFGLEKVAGKHWKKADIVDSESTRSATIPCMVATLTGKANSPRG